MPRGRGRPTNNTAFVKANQLGLTVTGWTANWPDGFGYLAQIVDSRVIRDAGNTNLGIVDSTIDARIDQALRTADQGAREGMWADIDHKVMEDAFVLPGVWPKGLIYRPPNLTNAFVSDGFQTYDYTALGTTRR
jgi:peptide/nickel transport system substrate-binding protein